jgi:hypothetical protein
MADDGPTSNAPIVGGIRPAGFLSGMIFGQKVADARARTVETFGGFLGCWVSKNGQK